MAKVSLIKTLFATAGCLISTPLLAQVTSTAGLAAALKTAHAGDVITLAPGNYAPWITYTSFATPVVITSADPTHPAVITGLLLTNSKGLTFSGLEFSTVNAVVSPYGALNTNVFQVGGSTNITFSKIKVHGSPTGTLANTVSGFLIRSSQYVTVQYSDFSYLHHAIGHLNDTYLTIKGNHFHNLKDDSIRGGGSSYVTVDSNLFESNHPDATDTDHPDCIQFWTSNTTAPTHDFVVTNNFYDRGTGHAVQGIFFGNELGIQYYNIKIANNVLAGAGYNGIGVDDAKTVEISNNIVAPFPDETSWIKAIYNNYITLNANEAASYGFKTVTTGPVTDTNMTFTNNKVISPVTDFGAALKAAWIARQPAVPQGY